ncbi:MAG TPA: branched-chain amino acid ABC transporter ATP-binding protein/permease [Casimicrobiaceae bacterium]|nr:branched-chain amino acid ABC transporter ATP-binding protein/permease [Casimicrobiaceae bacterium]
MKVVASLTALAAALALVPLLGLPPFYESFLYLVFHWMVLATSWTSLSGYSGYLSFGHGAFFGAGVYTTATLAASYDVPFLWTLPAAAAVAATLALAIGAVAFRVRRVRGELFALLTLAVTFVLGTVVLNTSIDGGPGVYLSAVPLPSLGPTPSSTFYLLALALAYATVAVAYLVARSRLGRGLFAIHDDEDVAEVMGVPTFRFKLAAFALSSALAAVAGGIHALFVSYVTVGETFSITVPLTVVLMSVLGGTRHWAGPALGAAAITALMYAFTAGDYAIAGKAVVGVVLILVILFMPHGLLGRRAGRRCAPAARADSPQAALAGKAAPAGAPAPVRAAVVLEVVDLAKAFEGVQALRRVSLDVRGGEVLGLLGPNGSGKSTLINVVSGHYRPDAGRIVFRGREIAGWPAHRIARIGIARTYQIPRPWGELTVRDNVLVAAMFGGATLARAAALREADRWLEFTGLAGKADARPDELNLHQRKFLELARALAFRPELVLLDEVLSGLNPAEIDSAVELVRDIRRQGATIVLVEHVMRAVLALADRIVVLNHGDVIAAGDAARVMQEPAVVTAYLGAPVHA